MPANPFEGLKPEFLWKHFEALTKIPRCSGNEAAAAGYIKAQAEAKGLKISQDDIGNVLVSVPASPGKEGKPVVIIQGHLDMVGEKDSDSAHDFDKDPIPVVREGDFITAHKTTLGADNGIGLAAGLSMLDDSSAVHGPIELLFTIDEERGLTGARKLQPGFAQGKILLNLDSEEEGSLYVGCAGGADTEIGMDVKRQAASGEVFEVRVKNMKGGHSGMDINTGRGNAAKVLSWFLDRLRAKCDFGLSTFLSGDKHNAIPREAMAQLALPAGGRQAADEVINQLRDDLKACYGKTDPEVVVEVSTVQSGSDMLTRADRDRFLDLVLAMPHGVLAMSQDVAGLVETSTNLAVVRLVDASATFLQSTRSSIDASIAIIQQSIMAQARLAGAQPKALGGYPGWQPNMDSALLARTLEVHKRVTGKDAEVKAIHAGLECGIIGERFGGMDMISFGPQIEWPHSPSERVKIDSVERFYNLLKSLLADLAA